MLKHCRSPLHNPPRARSQTHLLLRCAKTVWLATHVFRFVLLITLRAQLDRGEGGSVVVSRRRPHNENISVVAYFRHRQQQQLRSAFSVREGGRGAQLNVRMFAVGRGIYNTFLRILNWVNNLKLFFSLSILFLFYSLSKLSIKFIFYK